MLAQFQAHYPTGCLISELLQIHQGKFIIRVLVQIDGVTRATGMAAAEIVEQAEDRARSRALMVLGIDETYSSLTAESIPDFSSTVPSSDDIFGQDLGIAYSQDTESALQFGEATNTLPHQLQTIGQVAREPVDLSDTLIEIDEQIELSKWNTEHVREYLERVYQKQRPDLTPNELEDFLRYLKLFVKTTVELKRLGWTSAMGKDYLLQTYNKKARSMLSYEQLLEFLNYLESQPTPHGIA